MQTHAQNHAAQACASQKKNYFRFQQTNRDFVDKMSKHIYYSDKYYDDDYEYR